MIKKILLVIFGIICIMGAMVYMAISTGLDINSYIEVMLDLLKTVAKAIPFAILLCGGLFLLSLSNKKK